MADSAARSITSSPRKLNEMTLPANEGHDVNSDSGVSIEQYEERLNSLRKENILLKYKISGLKEKLRTGATPALQSLLEYNVRLQVEVEEMIRQLTEKQELVAATAETIDVLENQGSISTTTRKKADTPLTTHNKVDGNNTDAVEETYQSESAGDHLAVTDNNEDSCVDELTRLNKEYGKALLMIKECMKKIWEQEKEIKKLKLDEELTHAHMIDSQLKTYEEIKCKDDHIKELENKVRQLHTRVDNTNEDSTGNLQQLVTRRLQGLAYFLDQLLSHKCVLGEEKKKLAESILEQSLALPVGLELDESMVSADLTMDERNLDISQSMRLEDLTMMFGHHDDSHRYSMRKPIRNIPEVDVTSESEPNRNVSLARVSLCDTGVLVPECVSENKCRSRRSKLSHGSRSEESKPGHENILREQADAISKRNQILEEEKKDLRENLELAAMKLDYLTDENNEIKATLALEQQNAIKTNKNLESLKETVLVLETKIKENEQQISHNLQLVERLRSEKHEMESTFLETKRSLRSAVDEAAVQASQTALELARAQHDRLCIERELEETREKLTNAMEANSQLDIEIKRNIKNKCRSRRFKLYHGSRYEESKPVHENIRREQVDAISKHNQILEKEKKDLREKLELAAMKLDNLTDENNEIKATLALEQQNAIKTNKNLESLKETVLVLDTKIKENEQQISHNLQLVERLRSEKHEIESTFLETKRSLRSAVDEAAVQASQTALELARAQHDRLCIERELEETREKLTNAMEANSQLEIEIKRNIAMEDYNDKIEERPTSSDQGIDNDRLSSLEQNDEVNLSPRSLYEENVTLKQKLTKAKATLAEALRQLNATNVQKRSVKRAICREIHKTHGVLRKARDQLEHHNQQ